MMINNNCYVEFNSYLSVDIIKIQKNETEQNTTNYFDAVDDNYREKVNTNTVLFTSFAEVTGLTEQQKSVEAYYFDPEGSLSNATISIFRKTPREKYYKFIYTLDNKGFRISDYNIMNNRYYHYMASALVDTHIEPSEDNNLPRVRYYVYENKDENGNDIYINTLFDTWSICDLYETTDENAYQVNGKVWKLGLNIEGESITQNLGVSTWDTLGKYPKQAYGQKNYSSSQFTGLLGSIQQYDLYKIPEKSVYADNPSVFYDYSNVYQYTEKENITNSHSLEIEKLENWVDFITNGNIKLLRDMKGNGWIVQIVDTNTYEINNTSNCQQTTISFQWKEVDDIKKKSIVGLI